MTMVITRAASVREQAYEAVKQAILQGQWPAGTRIAERELCERLRISRTPVREAVQRLELEGYVRLIPRKGIEVREIAVAHPEEIFDLLGALEGLAVRWAAQKATPEQVEGLQDVLKQLAEQAGHPSAIVRLHQVFIDQVLMMADSDRLTKMLQPLHEFRRHMMQIGHVVAGRFDQSVAEHERIVAAIAAHRPQEAEDLVRYHLKQALIAYQTQINSAVSNKTP
ncbi:MAG: GntR family transcriptional regulator [Firmicutes bacterium]|nr:GntR family transcriptional regulator [Bacillota bacterium]